jgi:CheY-like chemotaxis protein
MAALSILLIEDSEPDVFFVREVLSRAGVDCELTVVENGERAIKFVGDLGGHGSKRCPDLVLLDLNLPRHNGDEVSTL